MDELLCLLFLQSDAKSIFDLIDPYIKIVGGVIGVLVALVGLFKGYIELKKLRTEANKPKPENAIGQDVVTRDTAYDLPFIRMIFFLLRSFVGYILGLFGSWIYGGAHIKKFLFVSSIGAVIGVIYYAFYYDLFGAIIFGILFGGGRTFLVALLIWACIFASSYAAEYGVYGNKIPQRAINEPEELFLTLIAGVYGAITATFAVILVYLLANKITWNTSAMLSVPRGYLILSAICGLAIGIVSSQFRNDILDKD